MDPKRIVEEGYDELGPRYLDWTGVARARRP